LPVSKLDLVCVEETKFVKVNLSGVIKVNKIENKAEVFVLKFDAQVFEPENELFKAESPIVVFVKRSEGESEVFEFLFYFEMDVLD